MFLRSKSRAATARRQRSRYRPRTATSNRLGFEPLEARLVLDSTVVFNEIMYNPAGETDDTLEWIELYNQLAVNIDVSEWSIEGGVDYDFPDGTAVPGRGFLVLAIAPQDLQAATGYADAMGPYTGRLSNAGEELRLINNDGRLMNTLDYGDQRDWPIAPDGSGATLAKQDPTSASESAENWVSSGQIGGTPGDVNFPTSYVPIDTTTLVPIGTQWSYEASGTDLGTQWREPGYDDGAWETTQAGFSGILITEASTRTDWFEIQNVSDRMVDTSGWVVAVNHGTVGIDAVNEVVWEMPDSIDAGEVLYRTDDSGDVENYFGGDISWKTSGSGWVIIVDDTGVVVDFTAWRYDEAEIASLQITVGGFEVSLADAWHGAAAPGLSGRTDTLQRSGMLDHNDASDFAFTSPTSQGEQNAELTTPFPAVGIELATGPTTHYFRTEFDFDYLPTQTELALDLLIDDGAVFYLNGVELYRHNMPSGEVSHTTLADTEVAAAPFIQDIPVPADRLVEGTNVLAVEVHQATVGDADMLFLAELNDTRWPAGWGRLDIDLGLNEVAAAGASPFWLELVNYGQKHIELEDYVIRSSMGSEYVLPAGSLAPGEFLAIDETELGFDVAAGDKLFLYIPDRSIVVDAAKVNSRLRGRSPDGTGQWLYPDVDTFAAANHFDFHDEIVINEILYQHHPWTNDAAQPYLESYEEWIELINRGPDEVDLSGWELDDGIGFDFPVGTTIEAGGYLVVAKDADALRLKYPAIADNIVGNYRRWLSNRGERIVLLDTAGNPADEVHYFESGRWSPYADGGGSSLELRDPHADNSKAETWAASDESGKSDWRTYTYRAVCDEPLSLSANLQHFILGLLDEGEFYLDDVSVRRDPDGANREVITNGTFQNDTIGSRPSQWRLVGNHSGTVQWDPENPGNKVLHFVASGPQQHIHDHVTTNFGNGESIRDGEEYEISLRAKWIAGSPQLNNRFYFTRMGNTFILEVPQDNGTPGAQNSTFDANVGPTYSDLVQDPALPAPDEPVTISVRAEDPDGIDGIELRWAVDEGGFQTRSMALDDGLYKATIEGQSSNSIVQFYVRSWDTLDELSTFPAAGEDSRALYEVDTTAAPKKPIDTVRIIMLDSDRSDLVVRYNEMSNMYFGVSVVHTINYGTGPVDVVYHDVEVRQIGSRFIRPNSGYKIRLRPDQKFYGVHESIRLDMSLMGEIYMKHMVARAGGSSVSMYDDVARMIDPRHGTRTVLLQLARYEDTYLNEQFVDGSEGTKWELDDIVIPTSPVQMGYNNDNAIQSHDMFDRGPNPESYRGHLLIKNQRYKDDYQKIVELSQAIQLTDETALYEATNEVMDVDLWMRHYATQSFLGNWDTYGFRRPKNLRIYVRPEDGKIIPLYWDADRGNLSDSLIYHGNLSRLDEIRDIPQNLRLFWGHMLDLINRSFNSDYMAPWMTYYSQLGVGMHSASQLNNRANAARNQARAAIPEVAFAISTNGGQPFSVAATAVTLAGTGWIDVREVRLLEGHDEAGQEIWSEPLEVTWTDEDHWQLTLPLAPGPNALTLDAFDFEGNPAGSGSITVNSTLSNRPLQQYLRITELNYNPVDPNEAEQAAGATNNDDFEFIELQNVGPNTIDLAGARFSEGLQFEFADTPVELAPGEFVVLVQNTAAFEARYGTEARIVGPFTSGRLSNAGERIRLENAYGGTIVDFEYDDAGSWPGRPDGNGATLEVLDPAGDYSDGRNWRSSPEYGGMPGATAGPLISHVVINEVLTNTDPLIDAIELYNTTNDPVDIGGWYLSDSSANYKKFRIPDETVIAGGGYLLFDEIAFNPFGGIDPEHPDDFALSGAHGDDVWLMMADSSDRLTHFVDHVEFGAAAQGESLGRWPNGTGDLYPMTTPTLAPEPGPNSGPRVGPLVISEVHYYPFDPPADPANPDGLPDPDEFEFIEIYNPTGTMVDLTDWRIRGGIDFDFAPGTTIAAAGTIVVLPFDPQHDSDAREWTAFCTEYGLDESQKGGFVGGYAGQLSDWDERLKDDWDLQLSVWGEQVRLLQPDAPPPNEPDFTPHVLEDMVDYLAVAPWPTPPVGGGESLNRTSSDVWGLAESSWNYATPTPGTVELATAAAVTGRYVFYNNSAFDTLSDDDAIAPDKVALLPGKTASFANYTSYVRGINGVMIDVAALANASTLGADDFQFRVGNDDDPNGWAVAPDPITVAVQQGAGIDGADRVKLIWEDNAIAGQWLQVTVLANADTGLASDDVFYVGNAIGEAGNSALNAIVNTTDEVAARNFQHGPADPAAIDDAYDYNRDQLVNTTDRSIARSNQTGPITALRPISAPAADAVLAQGVEVNWIE